MLTRSVLEPALLAVPPIVDEPETIFDWLASLRELGRLSRGPTRRYLLTPAGLVEALDRAGRYATVDTIKAILAENGLAEAYSPSDILRAVSELLVNLDFLAGEVDATSILDVHLVEPELPSAQDNALKECADQLVNSLCCLRHRDPSMHFVLIGRTNGPSKIIVTGEILTLKLAETDKREAQSIEPFKDELEIVQNWQDYLKTIDGYSLWRAARDELDMEISLFSETARKKCPFPKIKFGKNFVESLKKNSAWDDGPYTSAVYGACTSIAVNDGTTDVTPFFGGVRKKKNAVQKSKPGGFLAWRAQVTKKGVALRLMLWKDASGNLEFSRVGPKKELKIDID